MGFQQKHLQSGQYGATASFVGTMRDFNINESVSHMTLEHYPAMTQHYLDNLCLVILFPDVSRSRSALLHRH